MSVYLLNKILYMTDNDADFRKRIKEDPEGTIKSFPLRGDEIEAMILGDVGTLYQMESTLSSSTTWPGTRCSASTGTTI